MENGNNYRRMSFEELRRRRSGKANTEDGRSGRLFETDWEVFVAKYDRETGKYVSGTYCCDAAVS